MANEFLSSYMALYSDTDNIEFIGANATIAKYLDDTLVMETPDVEESRFTSLSYGGRTLKDVTYKTRNILFEIEVYGSNDGDVFTNVSRIQRMLSIATSPFYLEGGAHQLITKYTNYTDNIPDTGDSGLIFGFRIGRDAGTGYTNELEIFSANKLILYARALRAKMTSSDRYFTSTRTKLVGGINKSFRTYKIELECEPYLFQPSRLITTISGNGLSEGLVSPTNSEINRVIIAAADVAGTEPALTRITTNIQGGFGIIMGRDVGVSMLNSPSFPIQTVGSGRNDIYSVGDLRTTTGKTYKVKISSTGTPDQVQISTNGGSSWSSSAPISVFSRIQLGSDNAYVYFETSTGHTLNNEWTFISHQTVQDANITYDIYANRSTVYTDGGQNIKSLYYNIPPGCHSRYKLYARIEYTGFTPEISSKIYYGGYNDSNQKLYSGGASSDWTKTKLPSNWVDLGIIDLTANGYPSLMHPGGHGEIKIDVYARSASQILNPSTLTLDLIYLVPCPDENSWFHAGWTDDGSQYETYCNYDMSNPYMVETVAPGSGQYSRMMPLNGTYGGNFLTLIPNLDNTIIMIPLWSDTTDWRRTDFRNIGSTGYTTISHKPRYLVV